MDISCGRDTIWRMHAGCVRKNKRMVGKHNSPIPYSSVLQKKSYDIIGA